MAEIKEYIPEYPDWLMRLRAKLRVHMGFFLRPFDLNAQEPEQKDKLTLLYAEMIADIEKSDVSENIKKGVDPLPVMVGYLLAAAGGMGLSMILSSLLSPWIQAKLTYPLNRIATPYRLPPDVIFRLWWKLYKGEGTPETLLKELIDQGWDYDRIELGKESSKVMPTPADIIAFLAHEVFEPEMVDKYKLMSEWDTIDKEFAKRIGVDEEILAMYWKNHWVHPSLGSVYSMLHRDLIAEKDMKDYYRIVETPEFWRDNLTELSWDMPNRIEIRMMARYLDLDKDFIKSMLKKAGLHEDYRDAGADFMLVMGLYGYWSSLYRNGWVTKEGLRADMEAKGLDPVVIDRMYKRIVKAEQPERIAEHRKLTRALIIKGMKQEELTSEEAVGLLMEHQNYDRPEAEFIVSVEIAAMGSPHSYLEFKELVGGYKRAVGEDIPPIPSEVLEAGKTLAGLEAALKEKTKQKASQKVLNELRAEIAVARVKYQDLKALHEL